jgi:hypothetical protein
MYVKVDMYAGNMGGPIEDRSLPWTTLIDYLKVTRGAIVLFNDNFNLASTVQPGEAARNTARSAYDLFRPKVPKTWLRWSFLALIVCLTLLGAAIARRRMSV